MMYFITVLIMTALPIPTGWVQYSQAFSDKSTCETFVKHNKKQIMLDVNTYMGRDSKTGKPRLLDTLKFECMAYEEAVQRNSELGH